MKTADILIIGGGAAGMAAALAAEKKGYQKILIAERKDALGGVLLQCVHNGFGLGYFKEDLNGIQYAERFDSMLKSSSAQIALDTMVLKLFDDRTALLSGKDGVSKIAFDICVLATGCRERTLYSQEVSGSRPSGIMTAGTAQKLMNIDGLEIGDDIVILGTGDVGQIMARQLIQAGKRVIAMIEKDSAPGGLKRNQESCINAYQIPLILNTEIIRIRGKKRIEGITLRNSQTSEESHIECRTLLTAIGMIPETDLITNSFGPADYPDWIKKVGNCDFVHDIVDSVTMDGMNLWS